MNSRTIASASLAAIAAGTLLLAGCSSSSAGGSGAQGDELEGLTGEIGSKDFSEQYILAYMTAELLNAHGADVEANTKLVGSANVRQALENDQFLGYWEYTGTSWITYNGNTAPVQGAEAQFDAVKKADAENGIAWLDPAPFNNTYAFAIRQSEAEKLGVKTLSDVAKLPAQTRPSASRASSRRGTTAGPDSRPPTASTLRTRTSRCSTPGSSTPRPRRATTATSARSSRPTAVSPHSTWWSWRTTRSSSPATRAASRSSRARWTSTRRSPTCWRS